MSIILIDAAAAGDFKKVQECLERGIDPNVRDKDGHTALMAASLMGHKKIAQLLLAKGADVNAKANNGHTAMMFAAQHYLVMKLLLNKGADVNAKGKDGYTPLMSAARKGDKDTVQLLLDKNADVHAQDNLATRINNTDKEPGFNALMWAAFKGHDEIIKKLLAKGANINAKTTKGNTALIWAARNGHIETVKLLLKKGADFHAHTNGLENLNAQGWAAANRHKSIVSLLETWEKTYQTIETELKKKKNSTEHLNPNSREELQKVLRAHRTAYHIWQPRIFRSVFPNHQPISKTLSRGSR